MSTSTQVITSTIVTVSTTTYTPLGSNFQGYYYDGQKRATVQCDATQTFSTSGSFAWCCDTGPGTGCGFSATGCVSGNLIVGTTTGTCGSGSTCQSVFVYATNPTVGPIQTNVVCANTFHANTIFRTWLESATTTKTSTIYSLYPITAASQTSSAVPSTSSSSSGGGSGLSSSSVIAVAVVIPVVVLAIIATLLFFWWRRKSRTRNNPAVSGPAYDAVGDQRAYYAHNPDAVTGQTYEMGQENQPVELPNKNHPSNAAKVQEMYADNPNMGPHELTGSSPHGRR